MIYHRLPEEPKKPENNRDKAKFLVVGMSKIVYLSFKWKRKL